MFSRKEECPVCKSADNVAVYENDTGYESWTCFTTGCTNKVGDKQTTWKTYEDYYNSTTGENNRKMVNTKSTSLIDAGLAKTKYEEAAEITTTLRGIKPETWKTYGYRLGNNNRLVIPVKDTKGNTVGYKWRLAEKLGKGEQSFGWVKVSQETNYLIGMQIAAKDFNLIITEGELDALSAYQMTGGKSYSIVSVPNGASSALKAVDHNIDFVSRFGKVIIAMDNDEAGDIAAEQILSKYPHFKKLVYPVGIKDCNDWLVKENGKGFDNALYQTKQQEAEYIVGKDKRQSDLRDFYANGEDLGVTTGVSPLDELMGGFRKGETSMVIAGAGVGKSTLCRQIAYAQATYGRRTLVISSEENVRAWGVKLTKLRHGVSSVEAALETDEYLDPYVKYIDPLKFGDSLEELQRLVACIQMQATAFEADLVILDNITHLAKGASGDYYKIINQLSKPLTKLAMSCNTHLLVVGHETKKVGDKEPSLADSDGANALSQFSHNVLSLKREIDKEEGIDETNLHLLKRRESFFSITTSKGDKRPLTYDFHTAAYKEHKYNGNSLDSIVDNNNPVPSIDIPDISVHNEMGSERTSLLDSNTEKVIPNGESVLPSIPDSNVLDSPANPTNLGEIKSEPSIRQPARKDSKPTQSRPHPSTLKKPPLPPNRKPGSKPQPGLHTQNKKRTPPTARMQERWKLDREGRSEWHQMVADIKSGKVTKPWSSEAIQGSISTVTPTGETIPCITDWQLDSNKICNIKVAHHAAIQAANMARKDV